MRVKVAAAVLFGGLALHTAASAQGQVDVLLDRSEALASLAIMNAAAEASGPSSTQWRALTTSRPYVRLSQREGSFNVGFTNAEFRAFLTSPDQLARRVALADTLRRWSDIDMEAAGRRAFAYLPAGANLKAEVYFVIKPKTNSFVWDLTGEPAVFLYLDPASSAEETANTVAHELHHVGFASSCLGGRIESDTDGQRALRPWIGGFGEGLAMLAAAGGPSQHPHAGSPAATKARWDRSVAAFAEDMATQNAFFLKVLANDAGDTASISETMRSYYGEQGPWYSVGWKMAEVIERGLGRERVVTAFCQRGAVFKAYNEAARILNAKGEALPLWDQALAEMMDPAP